jgi:NitT/TauT family transport system ATP-binding protein
MKLSLGGRGSVPSPEAGGVAEQEVDTASAQLLMVDHVLKSFPVPNNPNALLPVVNDISFRMGAGEVVTLIGPSGCGKSTLLRIIAGLAPATSGQILIDGTPLRGLNRQCAVVFQHVGLVPWRTVERNVGLALELKHHRRLSGDDRDLVRETLRHLGLSGFESYYPYQISGGMQQRVGIARALVTAPRLLLMDEPFGALDAQTRGLLQDELLSLFNRLRIATVFVTHDLDEAVYLSDRVIVMSRRPANVREEISIPLPRPRTDYDARMHPEFTKLRGYLWQLLKPENVPSPK